MENIFSVVSCINRLCQQVKFEQYETLIYDLLVIRANVNISPDTDVKILNLINNHMTDGKLSIDNRAFLLILLTSREVGKFLKE